MIAEEQRAGTESTLPRSAGMDQLHVTHCLYGQGLSREAGFGVRASSTTDPLLLRFAREFPPHEIPAGQPPERARQLDRLALVRLPRGPRALVHSVALPGREGRNNNFFSHIIVLPDADPAAALATWGSPDWVEACPAGADTTLPTLDVLPTGGHLDEQAVTAFLDDDLSDDSPLVTEGLCPERLREDAPARRAILTRVLQGCLLVLQMPPGAPRARFTIVAEPEVVALCLFAAAQLLPPPLVAGLTFSTFEANPDAPWASRLPLVVGTLPDRPLEDAAFQSRGIACDSFSGRCSPELQAGQGPEVRDWVELAARGQWSTVAEVYRLLGRGAASVSSFKEALQAARIAGKLASGKATLSDAARAGPLMAEHRQHILPLLREAGDSGEAVPASLSPLVAESAAECEREFHAAVRADPPGDWQAPWRMLRLAWATQPARLREALKQAVAVPRCPPELRLPLLNEFHELNVLEGQQRQPPHILLRGCTASDLSAIAAAGLPEEWHVWSLFYALLSPETRDDTTRLVHADGGGLVGALWEQLRRVSDLAQRHTILAPLVDGSTGGVLFLSRSLRERAAIPVVTLLWMLERCGAWTPRWLDFWASGDNLDALLEQARLGGDEAEPIWARVFSYLGIELLTGEAPEQAHLLAALVRRRDRFGLSLPPDAAQRIADWATLTEHFEAASALPEADRGEAIAAGQRLGIDPVEALRRYYLRFVHPHELTPERAEDFVGFFRSFFPDPVTSGDHASLLSSWLEVTVACPDEGKRASLQSHYLVNHVPGSFRQRLAEEEGRTGRLLPGAAPPPADVPAPAPRPAPATAPAEQPAPAGVPEASPWPALAVSLAVAWLAFLVLASARLPQSAAGLVALAVIQAWAIASLVQSLGGKPYQAAAGLAGGCAAAVYIAAMIVGIESTHHLWLAASSAASAVLGASAGMIGASDARRWGRFAPAVAGGLAAIFCVLLAWMLAG